MYHGSIFGKIDEDQTVKNTRHFLEQYRRNHRIEQRDVIALQSPVMNGMPKGSGGGNHNQDKIISNLDAKVYCATVRNVIKAIENDTYRQIIELCYIDYSEFKNDVIASKLNMSKTTYNKEKAQALICFAELCPPMSDPNNSENLELFDLLAIKK